ncbi:MAG: hypothetical protein ACSHX7_08290 [Luteolibacter sp.]
MNPEPAPYPPKTPEEISAVATFLGLLDLTKIAPDVKYLDKVPNFDGTVELLDDDRRPVGDLKVQVKKVPTGATRFDCPIELVGYSERTSSPFILVCVDVEQKRAFWSHISTMMPGYKSHQKTFTVKFEEVTDEIGSGFPYIRRWSDLCTSYLERISQYPKYRKIIDEETALVHLEYGDRVAFQKFIEEVNILLDVDFPVLKQELFADAWKLGVTIHSVGEFINYSIYTIPLGENAPLLRFIQGTGSPPKIEIGKGGAMSGITSLYFDGGGGDQVALHWELRSYFDDPVKTARKFIFRHLKRFIRDHSLYVRGKFLSIEKLLWFADRFSKELGLEQDSTYTMSNISYGLNVYFPIWYSKIFPRFIEFIKENYKEAYAANPFPSIEQISSAVDAKKMVTKEEVEEAIKTRLRPAPYPIRTSSFKFSSLDHSLDYLTSVGVEEISIRSLDAGIDLIESGCDLTDSEKRVLTSFAAALFDYPEFILGNRFGRLESKLAKRFEVILLVREVGQNEVAGSLCAYRVSNPRLRLNPLTFIDLSVDKSGFRRDGNRVFIHSDEYFWTLRWSPRMKYSGRNFPIQDIVYDFLKFDLKENYGEDFDH